MLYQQSHDIMNLEFFIIVLTLATSVASNPLVYRVSVGELPEHAETEGKWVGIPRNNYYTSNILPRTGYPEQGNVVTRTSNVPECKHTPYTYVSQPQPVPAVQHQQQQQQQVQSQQQGFVRLPQNYPQYQPYYYYSNVIPISQQQKPILTPDQYTRQPVQPAGGVVQQSQQQQAKPLQTSSVQGVSSSQQGWQSYLCSVFPSLAACSTSYQAQQTQPLYSSYAGYPSSYSGYSSLAPVPVYYVIQTPEGRPIYAPGVIRPVQVPFRPEEPVKEKLPVESVVGEGEVVKEAQKEVVKEVVKPEDVVKTEVNNKEGEKVKEEKVQVKEPVPVKSEVEKQEVKKGTSEKVVEKKQ